MRAAGPLAFRRLAGAPGPCRVALVQTGAMLVSGDRVAIRVEIGPGAVCELVELGGTVSHDVRGGTGIEQRIALHLEAGARLRFAEQPLVLAEGTLLERRLDAALAPDAELVLRELVALGRDGEEPGAATLRLRVERAGFPLLDETTRTADLGVLRSPAVAGPARVLATLGWFGVPAGTPATAGAFALTDRDRVLRVVGGDGVAALTAIDRADPGPAFLSRRGACVPS
jgi:urease accessory protein